MCFSCSHDTLSHFFSTLMVSSVSHSSAHSFSYSVIHLFSSCFSPIELFPVCFSLSLLLCYLCRFSALAFCGDISLSLPSPPLLSCSSRCSHPRLVSLSFSDLGGIWRATRRLYHSNTASRCVLSAKHLHIRTVRHHTSCTRACSVTSRHWLRLSSMFRAGGWAPNFPALGFGGNYIHQWLFIFLWRRDLARTSWFLTHSFTLCIHQ